MENEQREAHGRASGGQAAGSPAAGPPGPGKNTLPLSSALAAASAGCVLMIFTRIALTGSLRYAFLIWNLFLAWIPYILSLEIRRACSRGLHSRKEKPIVLVLGIVWLLFYPNAPYILTDFIHVIRTPLPRYRPDSFLTSNAILWYDIILCSAFAFIGHIIGLISLAVLHRLIDTVRRRRVGWAVASAAVFLGGYGIYLGRFERLNTWDILKRPLLTTRIGLVNLVNAKAVLFAVCFGFFIFLTYLIVYSLYETAAVPER